MEPMLTILMPSYNYGHYLRQAISSILEQSFTDFEFLIIDDCSSDDSVEILKEYAAKDGRIRAYFHEKNRGMVECFNEGTALAKGKYIHYMAADDYRYPGFLQKCIDPLLKNPNLGMCQTQYKWGTEAKLILENCGYESDGGIVFLRPEEMASAFLKKNLRIFAVAAIVKRELVQKYGCFDPRLYYFNDWYLFNEIAFKHPVAIVKEPLSYFRVHEANFSNVNRHKKETKRAAYSRLLEKLNDPHNVFYKEQLRKSALLSFLFQDMFWRLLLNPRYLTYWPYINQKFSVKEKIKKSLKKKLGIKSSKS